MEKYISGWKCFSFAFLYDNIIFILEFSYDMSRNISEYVIFKRMAFLLLVVVVGIKTILQTTKKC